MFCQNCGQENVDSANYCVACGSRILIPSKDGKAALDRYNATAKDVDTQTPSEPHNVAHNNDSTMRSPETLTYEHKQETREQTFSKSKEVNCTAVDQLVSQLGLSADHNINLNGIKLSVEELLICSASILAIIALILPFFSFQLGTTEASGSASVNLISRGFWWFIPLWAIGALAAKRFTIVSIITSGITLVFSGYYLIGYISNGTSIGAGCILLTASGLIMFLSSIYLLLKGPTPLPMLSGNDSADIQSALSKIANLSNHRDGKSFSTKDIDQLDKTVEGVGKVCPKCGYLEDPDAKFCGGCGHHFA